MGEGSEVEEDERKVSVSLGGDFIELAFLFRTIRGELGGVGFCVGLVLVGDY